MHNYKNIVWGAIALFFIAIGLLLASSCSGNNNISGEHCGVVETNCK